MKTECLQEMTQTWTIEQSHNIKGLLICYGLTKTIDQSKMAPNKLPK